MSVCNDKVCTAKVCGTDDPCKSLIPSACGNTLPITMASCEAVTMRPNGKCLYTELNAPTCEEEIDTKSISVDLLDVEQGNDSVRVIFKTTNTGTSTLTDIEFIVQETEELFTVSELEPGESFNFKILRMWLEDESYIVLTVSATATDVDGIRISDSRRETVYRTK